jgi:hypothetical protein
MSEIATIIVDFCAAGEVVARTSKPPQHRPQSLRSTPLSGQLVRYIRRIQVREYENVRVA